MTPGQRVIWRKEERGGYGYVTRVLATFQGMSKSGKRALIQVRQVAPVERTAHLWVKPENLEQPVNEAQP